MKPLFCFAVVLLSVCDAEDKSASDLVKAESRKDGYDSRYYNEEDDRRVYIDRNENGQRDNRDFYLDRDESDRNGREDYFEDDYDEDRDYYRKRGAYVGNPDDFSKIERPCQNYDIYCIRRFFAEHAKCKIARGPVPDPLYRAQSTLYFPRVNLTAINNNVITTGVNGRVTEFYINKATDNLLIAIEFNNLNMSCPSTYFEFFRNGMEPVVTVAPTSTNFSSVIITAIIPDINDLQLDKAEVTAFSNDAFPPFSIGPSATESSDPQPASAFAAFIAGIPVNVQELFLTDAPFYSATYIQYNICDFDLKLF